MRMMNISYYITCSKECDQVRDEKEITHTHTYVYMHTGKKKTKYNFSDNLNVGLGNSKRFSQKAIRKKRAAAHKI